MPFTRSPSSLFPQILFTLTFWLLVRQSVKERFSKKKETLPPLEGVGTGGQRHLRLPTDSSCQPPFSVFVPAEEKAGKESVLKVVGATVMSCYAKYWIFVCGGMFIMVSFAGKLVGYKIVYMLMFLVCLCLYQVREFHI